jgi:molecular chaperone DnaK
LDIDANGIMNISAKDKGTGKENKITIKSDSGLSKEEIERMVQDAEANAESDKKHRELIEARNSAESTLNEFQADIDKYGDQVTAEEKANVEDAAQAIRDAIKGDDVKIIQDSIPKLYQAMSPITGKKHEAEEAAKKAEEQAKKDAADGVIDTEAKEAV